MAMITAGDFRNGVTFEMDGKVMQVVEFQHVKPGKGAAFVRTKMKNVITGAVTETSFNPTAKFEQAFVDRKEMEYSYNDGDLYYFMDMESYEMTPINKDVLGDNFKFVKENMPCKIMSYKGSVFGVEPPNFVELEVTQTDPGFKGDTATNVTKPATLETGAEVKVPLFPIGAQDFADVVGYEDMAKNDYVLIVKYDDDKYYVTEAETVEAEVTAYTPGTVPSITAGGEKYVLTLAAHGFHAICFNSETSVIPAKTVRKLVYRFKHIVLLYDTDKTGLECSEKHRAQLAEYGVKRLVLPLPGTKAEKDVTDYFKAGHTREELMGLFLKLLDTLYGDTLAMLKSCEIDYDHPPEQAVAIVTAGDVPLGSEENILCITGGEGTGKSNYTAALVAGAIMERETDADLLGVRVEPNRKGRAVLLYDTEQSEQQLHKNTGRLLRRAGRERMPEYLHVYCLTGMSRSERLTAIVQSMDRYHYLHGGIHLVVIDGVADLIRCANDEAESVALIDEIYRLAGIYRTCIAAVVHFVPNGLKLRGHLGSELQRKSAAILSIEKDENPEVSVVKALKVRDGSPLDIPLMQFRWDKQAGMPVYVGEKPRAEKEKRKEKELAEMAREAFARQEKYGYIELCELIQEMLEVKERTAKGYIRYMREKEIIEKEGDCYVHGQGRV